MTHPELITGVTIADDTRGGELRACRAKIAARVGCPAQGYVSTLHRTVGGYVHAGYLCFYVRGPNAVPIEDVADLKYHECDGCRGDHVEIDVPTRETTDMNEPPPTSHG